MKVRRNEYIDPSEGLRAASMRPKLIMAAVTGVLIAAAIVIHAKELPADVIRVLPLYVSLFVMLLQTNASRYAFLVGGINSVLYAGVYFSIGLYASAVSALAVSFPLQIVSFIRWGRHRYGRSTVFRRLGARRFALCVAGLAAAYGVTYLIFSALGSRHLLLDNSVLRHGTQYARVHRVSVPAIRGAGHQPLAVPLDLAGDPRAVAVSDLYGVQHGVCRADIHPYPQTLPSAAARGFGPLRSRMTDH